MYVRGWHLWYIAKSYKINSTDEMHGMWIFSISFNRNRQVYVKNKFYSRSLFSSS